MQRFLSAKPSKEFVSRFGKGFILSAKPLHKTNATGISFVIRAMQKVIAKHPECKYVIAGGGEGLANLQSLVKELGLEKNVLFAGWIDSKRLPELYASAGIAVHSFIFRASTSIALIESMAAGKAIVATDSGEAANAIKGAALLANPEDSDSIAGALLKLIENPELQRELGQKAQKTAKENYSIEAVAGKFEKLYSRLKK